jgi:branched-chain amino acid transport system permease protein
MALVVQALINGLVSGALLAVPAIGFTAMFAVLRFPNFSVSRAISPMVRGCR